jgi:hypothetical protein
VNDTVTSQRLGHRVDFIGGQHEVSGDRSLPSPVGWKLIAWATPIEGGIVGLRIKKPLNEPAGCRSIDLNSLARNPLQTFERFLLL